MSRAILNSRRSRRSVSITCFIRFFHDTVTDIAFSSYAKKLQQLSKKVHQLVFVNPFIANRMVIKLKAEFKIDGGSIRGSTPTGLLVERKVNAFGNF